MTAQGQTEVACVGCGKKFLWDSTMYQKCDDCVEVGCPIHGDRAIGSDGKCYASTFTCWAPLPGDDIKYAHPRCSEHHGEHYSSNVGTCHSQAPEFDGEVGPRR